MVRDFGTKLIGSVRNFRTVTKWSGLSGWVQLGSVLKMISLGRIWISFPGIGHCHTRKTEILEKFLDGVFQDLPIRVNLFSKSFLRIEIIFELFGNEL